jgi:rhamnose utilization protein RhaD (predicted bifunctional aldolase and dehydrogenase)
MQTSKGDALMNNLWQDTSAASDGLGQLLYASRLLGAEDRLVLHGGGNTSLKIRERDPSGADCDVLRIKGSGTDLRTCEAGHFPSVRLDAAVSTFARDHMSDEEMVAYLQECLLDPAAPRPSIETMLHAFVPYACVLHSHADALVALMDHVDGRQHLRDCFGDAIAVIDYERPGFQLAKKAGAAAQRRPDLRAIVLWNHGLVTYAASVKDAYDLHIDLVTRAEGFIRKHGKPVAAAAPPARPAVASAITVFLTELLGGGAGSTSLGQGQAVRLDDSPEVRAFLAREDAAELTQVGPVTPDHILHTKRTPLFVSVPDPTSLAVVRETLARAVEQFRRDYIDYFNRYNRGRHQMLDPSPRVILVEGLGMWTVGKDAKAADKTHDIYRHTMAILADAQSLGRSAGIRYRTLPESDAFEVEYWPLELYKLQRPEAPARTAV